MKVKDGQIVTNPKTIQKPTLLALPTILLRVSTIKMNNKGERGSPWRSSLEAEKKPLASPLMTTEKQTVHMQRTPMFSTC